MMRPEVKRAIATFKTAAESVWGSRLKRVVLYGSQARDTARADSDVDLMVVLGGAVRPGIEVDRVMDSLTDIVLDLGVVISIFPIAEQEYTEGRSPLLLQVRQEGVPA